jgi:hypothetical protein
MSYTTATSTANENTTTGFSHGRVIIFNKPNDLASQMSPSFAGRQFFNSLLLESYGGEFEFNSPPAPTHPKREEVSKINSWPASLFLENVLWEG